MNNTVAAGLDARGALHLSRGSEIILLRISLILRVLIRALLEWLKSGQSVAAEAAASVLLAGVRAAGPCVLQISLISLLMDCPAPASVSGGGGGGEQLRAIHPVLFPQGYAKPGMHFKLPLHLQPLLYPNLLSCADCSLA